MPLRGCKGLLKAGFLKHDDGVPAWFFSIEHSASALEGRETI